MFSCPPISDAASKSVTSCPRSAADTAHASPAGPAPTTAIRLRSRVGASTSSVSWQARGLTRQDVIFPLKVWSRQAWLHPMQVLISSARPSFALPTKSGSARNGRASETMSARPSASNSSATSGVLIRLLVTSGTETDPISRFVTQVYAPRGTDVAMVGMRASCHPIPVLMIVAPAASISLASVITSSSVEPPGTRSSIDSR